MKSGNFKSINNLASVTFKLPIEVVKVFFNGDLLLLCMGMVEQIIIVERWKVNFEMS
jgi:hypothetical protein